MMMWLAAAVLLPTIGAPDAPVGDRKTASVPRLNPRVGESGASGAPWLDANGWRYRRTPGAKWVVTPPKGQGALAAAEAFAYRADVLVRTDPGDRPAVDAMMKMLTAIPAFAGEPVADVTIEDDGSHDAAEALNLLARRNLQYGPRAKLKLNPKGAARNPSQFAYDTRRKIGDDQRALRVYGSQVVLGYLESEGGKARLHLLNYGRGSVDGLRLRVRGAYRRVTPYGTAANELASAGGFTEFTLSELHTYAVLDLAP